ncbi:MAG: putative ABC transporter permease [Clostridia bacterium]|nr:putative ABC transporter permease [Clostridia bacterium]
MKKETLIEIGLANLGGLFLAIGLFMIFMNDWNLRTPGIVSTAFGVVNLIALFPVRKKFDKVKISRWKSTLARFIMIVAAIAMGSGASQMIAQKNMTFGLVIWILGMIFSTLSYPILEYVKKDKEKIAKTIVGTIGCILLFVGMNMTFIGQWNLIYSGTIVGLAGVIFVTVFVYINRKENQEYYYINIRFIALVIIEIIGAFLTVFGVVKVSSTDITILEYHNTLIIGLIACAIGFIISALSIPMYIFFSSNNPEKRGIQIYLKSKEHAYSARNIILMFFVYALLGWIVEFSFYGVTNGIFVNRGFLHLPLLPIYGFGAVVVTIIFRKNQDNVFIKSAIIVSILEYLTSVILEKIYGFRWWDYSKNPWNINGRICLLNSLMFGLGGYAIAKFISPYLNIKLNKKGPKKTWIIDTILLVTIGIDFIYTLFNLNTGFGITTTETKKIDNSVNEIVFFDGGE